MSRRAGRWPNGPGSGSRTRIREPDPDRRPTRPTRGRVREEENPPLLRAEDTAARERKSLDRLWSFALDVGGAGRAAGWFRRPLADAREMAVPASFNDIAADAAVRDHVGEVW